MGGRGGSSGMSGNSNSAEYKSAYATETSNARDFAASFVLDANATKASIGYEMSVYQSATGKSLIAETNSDIKFLKSELRQANTMGAAYGMSKDAIGGMKAGLREKISLRQKAVDKMTSARGEYEKQRRAEDARKAKAKRLDGRWM